MSLQRTKHWRFFARRWFLYDAYMQCPMLSGQKLATYLSGHNKRNFDDNTDIGDNIIVINTRHVAVKDNSRYWKRFMYPTHTRFGITELDETMEEIHKRDPTRLIELETRVNLNVCRFRSAWLSRLHCFADGVETVPNELLQNLNGVLKQVMPVPKRLDEYSAEEIEKYPKLFDWPEDFLVAPLSKYSRK